LSILPALATGGLSRRDLLKYASVATAGAAVSTAGGAGTAAAATTAGTTAVQWPGHKPGRIYLGASSYDDISTTEAKTGDLGLQRTYYRWDDAKRENANISKDHAAGRLPWISFKPPSDKPGGWRALSSGKYDADLRARARRYAAFSKPVIVTFNHEPQNDNTGTPAEFAQAWTRIHDVMKSETGLKNVVSVPIIGEWVFNPVNKGPDPEAYVTSAVLSRCHFLGVDLYQNESGQGYSVRLDRVLKWLDARGRSSMMVGVGETGATDDYRSPTGAQWWSSSWSWAVANRDRVAAISYFNSLHNNNSGNNWLLTQSSAKLAAFRSSLSSSTACTL